jgi:hypothetical protein
VQNKSSSIICYPWLSAASLPGAAREIPLGIDGFNLICGALRFKFRL